MKKSALPSSLKEGRAHGSETFRFGFYAVDTRESAFRTPLHWHEEFEIIYFQQGDFTLEINMERYEIRSEALYFIRPGELHRIQCPTPCRESAIVFSPYLLGFLSNDAAQSRLISPFAAGTLLPPRRLLPSDPGFSALLPEFQSIAQQCGFRDGAVVRDETQQLLIKAALLKILGICSAHHLLTAEKDPRNENIEDLKRVLTYIHSHFQERIYVRDLAALLNLNEQYFCRFFKKAIGQSPMAYVNAYRIRRALSLLRTTSLPVTEICLECGFGNFGNFLREFKKQTGTTPLKYRGQFRLP